MNRVRFAISIEGIAAYPQSADGRLAGSDPSQTSLGEVVEDRYNYDDDDSLAGIGRLNVSAQAAKWRQKIEKACNMAEMSALRIYYGTDASAIENACETLGHILVIEGRGGHYIMTQCWILAMAPEQADSKIEELVLDLYHSAKKKAERAVM